MVLMRSCADSDRIPAGARSSSSRLRFSYSTATVFRVVSADSRDALPGYGEVDPPVGGLFYSPV